MFHKKFLNRFTFGQLTIAVVVAYLAYSIFSLVMNPSSVVAIVNIVISGFLMTLTVIDLNQTKHTIRKNYPIFARFRYMFESIRPEMRQYFWEGELDGKPFNRRERSIVYQRAKNEKQTVSFGMQDDPNRIGYEWASHSVYPKHVNDTNFRVNIGSDLCTQPYSASIYNISAMSYGALSKRAITALNEGAKIGNFAHNTGEGGISQYHRSGGDLIWQIGTGYFGCRNEKGFFDDNLFEERANYPEVKMIEIKLSQGAKPGHGGLLPAEKNTEEIAKIRSIVPHTTVHSPSGHTAFSTPTELIHFIEKLRKLSNGKPVGFKICIGRKDEFTAIIKAMVETGIYPDFITVDGAEGGTGAAPLEFIDYMGMALNDALVFANKTLIENGLRDNIKLLASGRIISAFDIAKAMALGADACYSARGMMFALGCIQALQCDSGHCPVGIATQDEQLYSALNVTDKRKRVANFHANTMKALGEFISACGYEKPVEIDPKTFHKRVDHGVNKSFQEMYFGELDTRKKA
ncbi:FMN-binding glutamate synthase family protein [Myroides pelagicus]|uniref:FMN-binding glutamate synthase family protein n=1 Tax=Myroides pelagicus TaxID=270914 RepID=A0A7K1GM17_9FLAO|nr:FMN-binding glutamate synthase family protein [Myroides pelagicus]MEC4113171.1 FMN-binding glutamate synthase family protein [Myroides pelagicus]MTH29780.1 FMN-binding glutamate synthase family protein [Myroides pelagicus]